MLFPRPVLPALLASLALACSTTRPPPQAPPSHADAKAGDDYVTIVPYVTVSKNAEDSQEPRAELGAGPDVMAEILAIPPGN
jgi:hypothetical protein